MKHVIAFLIATDGEAALRFYRDTLGLRFVEDDGFALVFDLDGTMLRINKMPDYVPAKHTVLGWRSEDIAADVDALAAKGITFNRYPDMGQDERGICTFPGGDKVAWFNDPAGNVLSLSQHARE
jgi:catechol 2,3-dioxygenase-like lactoylglutathione lyase family enzyme